MKPPTSLITGGSGYLASRLVSLIDGDVHVLAGTSSDLSHLPPTSATIHRADGSVDALIEIIEAVKPDRIFHLATHYLRHDDPARAHAMVEANIAFGTNVLSALVTSGLGKSCVFVFAGTYFEYYSERAALNLYAATKRAFDFGYSSSPMTL